MFTGDREGRQPNEKTYCHENCGNVSNWVVPVTFISTSPAREVTVEMVASCIGH